MNKLGSCIKSLPYWFRGSGRVEHITVNLISEIYLAICTKDFYFIRSTSNFLMIQYRLCFTNVGKNISITSSWRITDQTFERRHYNNSNSSCWLIQRSRFIPSFTGTGSLEWKTGKTWWVKQVRWRLAREGGGGGEQDRGARPGA